MSSLSPWLGSAVATGFALPIVTPGQGSVLVRDRVLLIKMCWQLPVHILPLG